MRMGQIPIGAITSLASMVGGGDILPGSGGGSAPAGGTTQSTAVDVEVSPTFQQAFTPQFSPVMQQSQGGGDQTASTIQEAGGGQTAGGGGPGLSLPGFDAPTFADSSSPDFSPVSASVVPNNKMLIMGLLVAAGFAAFVIMQPKKPKPAPGGYSGRVLEHAG